MAQFEKLASWVLIIAVVLLLLFVIIYKIGKGSEAIPGTGNAVECTVQGGTCVPQADCGPGDVIDTDACGTGSVCCEKDRS